MENNAPKVEQAGGAEQPNKFESVRMRLEEIAREVDDESLSLDEALDLYEEAVKLGLQASDLLEAGIIVEYEPEQDGAVEGPSEVQSPAPDSSPVGGENASTNNNTATAN